MHELSVALSLVEIACDERARLGLGAVVAVRVRVGPLSGVVPEALAFAFDDATAGTAIAGARLDIEPVAAAIYCDICGTDRELPSVQYLHCPVCDEPALAIVRGRELELVALEIDDGPENR